MWGSIYSVIAIENIYNFKNFDNKILFQIYLNPFSFTSFIKEHKASDMFGILFSLLEFSNIFLGLALIAIILSKSPKNIIK